METLFIPNEHDFRKWILKAVKESLQTAATTKIGAAEKEESLVSGKEISGYLGISLVTLTGWMKKGLPFNSKDSHHYQDMRIKKVIQIKICIIGKPAYQVSNREINKISSMTSQVNRCWKF